LSVLSALLFGLVPALRVTRAKLSFGIRSERTTPGDSASRWALNKLVIMSQIALAMLLLAGAGLFLRTLYNLKHTDTGFDKDNIVVFSVNEGLDIGRTLARLEALPGVESASVWENGLLRPGIQQTGPIFVEGYVAEPGVDLYSFGTFVGPGFFKTMGITLLSGRDFTPEDALLPGRPVAVISAAMAKFFFGNQDPVGRTFRPDPNPRAETIRIIGVAEDAKYATLRDEPTRTIYWPLKKTAATSTYAIRTQREPAAIASEITAALQEFDADIRVGKILRMSEAAEGTLKTEPLIARFASGFSLLSLFLVCVGLYGTLSYSVALRTGEIGIRMALGAGVPDVITMLMRETGWIVGVGIVVGITLIAGTTQLIASLLYGLTPTDPITIAAAALLLVAVAATSAYLPARRASRVDPMVALRHE